MNQQSTYNNEIILKLKLIPTYAANSRPCANAELTILICLYILELITEIFKTCVRGIYYGHQEKSFSSPLNVFEILPCFFLRT